MNEPTIDEMEQAESESESPEVMHSFAESIEPVFIRDRFMDAYDSYEGFADYDFGQHGSIKGVKLA